MGESWTYLVLAVSAAGKRGNPGAPLTATSQPSVPATGTAIATIGAFDGRTLEHRFAPGSYSLILVEHREALIEYRDGTDEPGTAWPYLLPGPGDAWAGRKAYRAHWTLILDGAPAEDHDLAVCSTEPRPRTTTSRCGWWTPPGWAASYGSARSASTSPTSSSRPARPAAPGMGCNPARLHAAALLPSSPRCRRRYCRRGRTSLSSSS